MNQPGPTDLLSAAITTATPILALIGPEDLGRPTPCIEWTLRDLLQHIAGRAVLAECAARGIAITTFPEAEADLLGDDPAKTVAALLTQAAAAWQRTGADLSAPCTTPIGVMPGSGLVTFLAQDVFVHTWDLGKAIGQHPDFDPQLTATMLALHRQTITEDFRAAFFAPAIPVPDSATDLEKLVAFLGRQP
jgi:uncharacterized protein (TIGR03086 family)